MINKVKFLLRKSEVKNSAFAFANALVLVLSFIKPRCRDLGDLCAELIGDGDGIIAGRSAVFDAFSFGNKSLSLCHTDKCDIRA